jgi:hypothetical protein
MIIEENPDNVYINPNSRDLITRDQRSLIECTNPEVEGAFIKFHFSRGVSTVFLCSEGMYELIIDRLIFRFNTTNLISNQVTYYYSKFTGGMGVQHHYTDSIKITPFLIRMLYSPHISEYDILQYLNPISRLICYYDDSKHLIEAHLICNWGTALISTNKLNNRTHELIKIYHYMSNILQLPPELTFIIFEYLGVCTEPDIEMKLKSCKVPHNSLQSTISNLSKQINNFRITCKTVHGN